MKLVENTEEQINQEMAQKKKARNINYVDVNFGILYALIIILFVLLFLFRCTCNMTDMQPGTVNMWDNNTTSSRNIQDEVNSIADKNKFTIFINKNIVMDNGSEKANLLIQNEEVNNKPVVVELYLEDNNELLYKSYAIPAGYKIETAKLEKVLPKGVYKCKANFNILDEKSNETLSTATVKVTITVNN